MNPISLGSKTPPPVAIQNNLYSLLEKTETTDEGLNSIGNLEVFAPSCELYSFLKHHGAPPLRHISAYQSYDPVSYTHLGSQQMSWPLSL